MGLIRHHPHRNRGLHRLFKEFRVATQAEVDNLTQEAQQIRDNLATAKQNIEDRFAALEQAIADASKGVKEAVDLTGLKEAIGALNTPSQELEDLEPIQASPVPAQGAAPVNADGTAVQADATPPSGQNPNQPDPSAPAGAADTTAEDAAREQV